MEGSFRISHLQEVNMFERSVPDHRIEEVNLELQKRLTLDEQR